MDGEEHFIDKWDLMIAHPPCTYLTVSGNRWFEVEKYGDKARLRQKDRYKGIVFFMHFALAPIEKIAIENPIGIMSTCYRKPDQTIQPYQFGHKTKKGTCLWLKGLPKLKPTNIVEPELISYNGGAKFGYGIGVCLDENGKVVPWNDPRTAKLRSKTFPGIAKAMAEQWG